MALDEYQPPELAEGDTFDGADVDAWLDEIAAFTGSGASPKPANRNRIAPRARFDLDLFEQKYSRETISLVAGTYRLKAPADGLIVGVAEFGGNIVISEADDPNALLAVNSAITRDEELVIESDCPGAVTIRWRLTR